jgi:DNA polymerase III alpha subunit
LLDLYKMKQNKFGQLIFSESDVFDLVMQAQDLGNLEQIIVDNTVNIDSFKQLEISGPRLETVVDSDMSVEQWHKLQQSNWHMPDNYKNLDIADHVLSLCQNQEQLQRCGQELLLYQERELFDLLRYLVYLVDVMKSNNIIWGVGRGSSVASYVLYKLEIHRIDSMYYDLDPLEFLR